MTVAPTPPPPLGDAPNLTRALPGDRHVPAEAPFAQHKPNVLCVCRTVSKPRLRKRRQRQTLGMTAICPLLRCSLRRRRWGQRTSKLKLQKPLSQSVDSVRGRQPCSACRSQSHWR